MRSYDNNNIPVSQAQIENSAEMVLNLDCSRNEGWCVSTRPPDWKPMTQVGAAPHLEGFSVAFADGHAKWFPKSSDIGKGRMGTGATPEEEALIAKYWKPNL